MTVKLRDIPILLHIVKSHQKDNKAKRDEVKKTFENTEPTREATLPDYLRLEQFCLEAEILLFEKQNLVLTKIGEEILQESDDDYDINQSLKELFVKKCYFCRACLVRLSQSTVCYPECTQSDPNSSKSAN